jgi:transcriptional regulator with XRE-family HTH domain
MTEYKKVNHQLPPEIAIAVAELEATLPTAEWKKLRNAYSTTLRRAGWTLQSVADLFDQSRERVRQVVEMTDVPTAEALTKLYGLTVPPLPLKPVKEAKVYVEPSPETLARLIELQPLARKVRSSSPNFRAEAEEYARLLNYSHKTEGVTLYRLAKRLEITHGAIRGRLVRYGYLTTTSTNKVYQVVLEKNRVR